MAIECIEGNCPLAPEAFEEQQSSGPAGVWIQIADAQGHLIFGSETLKRLEAPLRSARPADGVI